VSRSVGGARPGEAHAGALAAVIFVALALATLLALFHAQELKRQDPLVLVYGPHVVNFHPGGDGRVRDAHFPVRTSVGDEVVASIVRATTGLVVRVLPGVVAHEYRHVSLTWNGRTSGGTLEPPGSYLVRVHLVDRNQTIPLTWVTLRLGGPSG
jgi:hypothetical protein